MNRAILLCLTSALALSGCGGADKPADAKDAGASKIAAPAGSNWAETFAANDEGGMVMGNPAAPVKLIEYGALSCSHCASFAEESKEGLRKYIEKGTVSYEFRTYLLNPQDVPAALLARCNGPASFFAISDQMFAAQRDWLGKSASITEADQKKWVGQSPNFVAADLAEKLGLVTFVQQRGVPADKAKACLADPKGVATLESIVKGANEKYQISGTPTFIINGVKVENTSDWKSLEPKLREAGA